MMHRMANAIEVKNLIKRYKNAKTNAVDDISFSVKEGEFFAFLGPNGAGKTTTISILTTTLAKSSGEVTIAGYDVDHDQREVRQQVGVIFQKPSLDENLTAEENIRFHAILYGVTPFAPTYAGMPNTYKRKIKELTELLDIGKEIFDPIKTFSGGMKRKLEIIRSLMHNPKVLFLDEPTSGLDPVSRKNLWDYLKGVRASQKTTIFLTTHYLEEVEDADRVCIVNHGKIITNGTPAAIKGELTNYYVLVDAHNRKKLYQEITDMKLRTSDTAPYKIYLTNHEAQRVIQSIQTPLTTLQIHTPTLEDAYTELVSDHAKS